LACAPISGAQAVFIEQTLMQPIILCALIGISTQLPAPPKAIVDPAAAKTLEAMVKTYRSLSRLRQDTVYNAGEDRLPPIAGSRLLVSRPNRLLLEMRVRTPERAEPYRLLYQSDGRDIYSYQEMKGFYVKEKAPRSFKELQHLAVSVELAAITGLDPVEPLLAQSRTVKMGESLLADGVPAEVVVFDMSIPDRTVSLRLTIGEKDHLLRRFEYSSIPILKPEPEEIKPKEDDPDFVPPPFRKKPESVRLSYDNHVMPDLPKDAFLWVAPPGAFASREYPTLLNPRAGADIVAGPPGSQIPGNKPMKILKYEDVIKQSRKKR
jgi:hypothetical protein